MRRIALVFVLLLAAPGAVRAQDVTVPKNIDRLADKAVQTVNITVDGTLLQLAGKFLSSNDPEQKAAKSVIAGLKGIYVRSFEFAAPGEYSQTDVESLRAQVKGPAWTKMASVRSRKEGQDVDVFVRIEKEKIVGLVVIAAEATQLTFVNIVGPIDLEQLTALGGQLGIPKLEIQRLPK